MADVTVELVSVLLYCIVFYEGYLESLLCRGMEISGFSRRMWK